MPLSFTAILTLFIMGSSSPPAETSLGEDTALSVLGEHGPGRGQTLQGMCHMPEVQAANASKVTTHKHNSWTPMADDCN